MNRNASRRQLGAEWNRRGEWQAGSMTRAVGAAQSTLPLLWTAVCAIGAWCAAGTTESFGADGQADGTGPKLLQTTVDRAIAYLAKQQDDDGSLSSQMGIGPTALTTLGLLRNGRGVADPQVAKGLEYLAGFLQADGGIHPERSRVPNYETCVALVCFQEANRDGRYDKVIRSAEKFIRTGQFDEGEDKGKSDLSYGGAGYGGKSRPDLSNTAYLVDALQACGAGPNDPAIQKALVFVSRCQNLESEHNTTKFAAKVNDGGFYYSCVLDRQDDSRQGAEEGLQSYGAMSYSGVKSLVYAGLTKDDPRVKAAVGWIRKHYDVKSHPGMGDAGLYYYYHSFAKTLDVLGIDEIEDAQGVKHDWRRDLTEELARRQQANGGWVNANSRWMESDPNLATSFALLALSYCRPVAASGRPAR
ncbi:MAG: terpene cyclase/mutase family protein [Planctomycetota bacterium]|nr:terpene cyclase/mutase family protein [Planctomycetota bacterium]